MSGRNCSGGADEDDWNAFTADDLVGELGVLKSLVCWGEKEGKEMGIYQGWAVEGGGPIQPLVLYRKADLPERMKAYKCDEAG